MRCSSKTRNGTRCKNNISKKSNYCHIHLPVISHDKIIDVKSNWLNDTFPVTLFSKKNVPEDGWCFFHSIGMSLLNIYNKKTPNQKIQTFFNQEIFEPFVKKKNWNNKKFKELLLESLLDIFKIWVSENLHELFGDIGITIHDYIIYTFNFDKIDDYFSIYDTNKNLPNKYWGGEIEPYIFSKCFEINIIVFTTLGYSIRDKKYNFMVKISQKNITENTKRNIKRNTKINTTLYKLWKCHFSNILPEKSMILEVFNNIKDNDEKGEISSIIEILPDEVKEKTLCEFNNTIFLLVFNVEKDTPHYNYLLLTENIQ